MAGALGDERLGFTAIKQYLSVLGVDTLNVNDFKRVVTYMAQEVFLGLAGFTSLNVPRQYPFPHTREAASIAARNFPITTEIVDEWTDHQAALRQTTQPFPRWFGTWSTTGGGVAIAGALTVSGTPAAPANSIACEGGKVRLSIPAGAAPVAPPLFPPEVAQVVAYVQQNTQYMSRSPVPAQGIFIDGNPLGPPATNFANTLPGVRMFDPTNIPALVQAPLWRAGVAGGYASYQTELDFQSALVQANAFPIVSMPGYERLYTALVHAEDTPGPITDWFAALRAINGNVPVGHALLARMRAQDLPMVAEILIILSTMNRLIV